MANAIQLYKKVIIFQQNSRKAFQGLQMRYHRARPHPIRCPDSKVYKRRARMVVLSHNSSPSRTVSLDNVQSVSQSVLLHLLRLNWFIDYVTSLNNCELLYNKLVAPIRWRESYSSSGQATNALDCMVGNVFRTVACTYLDRWMPR